jgi:hypothetical protein
VPKAVPEPPRRGRPSIAGIEPVYLATLPAFHTITLQAAWARIAIRFKVNST